MKNALLSARKFFSTRLSLIVLFFSTIAFVAIFSSSLVQAANDRPCITRNNQKECFFSLKFNNTADTKKVDTSHLIETLPRYFKFWPLQNIGSGWGFRNRDVRVSSQALPKLKLLNRINVDGTADTIDTQLQISGKTAEYWYLPQGWRRDGGNPGGGGTSFSSLMSKCACQKAQMYSISSEIYPYTRCGFGSAQQISIATRNANKTTDPRDCYVDIQDESTGAHYYYIVNKIPAFSLEEITHNDKLYTLEALNASKELARAIGRSTKADGDFVGAGKIGQLQRFRIFWRCGVGSECNYVHHEPDNQFEEPKGRSIQSCGCAGSTSSAGCSTNQGHIPWDRYSCYDEFTQPSKTVAQSNAEIADALVEKSNAEVAVVSARDKLNGANHRMSESIVDAKQKKIDGRYYPYTIYSGDRSTRPSKPQFIMLYNVGETLPETYPARQTGAEYRYFPDSVSDHACRVGGYFKNIERGVDYTTYTLEARGTAKNEVPLAEQIQRAGDRSIFANVSGGVAEFPIDGSECRLTMGSGLFNTDVTYFYSVGPVVTPPVEIQTFSISGTDLGVGTKTETAGVCNYKNQVNCLPVTQDVASNVLKEHNVAKIIKRPDRTQGPQRILDLAVADGQNAHVAVQWSTKNAVDVRLTKREHFNINDPDGKNEVAPLDENERNNRLNNREAITDSKGSNTSNPAMEIVDFSGKREYDLRYGPCRMESGRQRCEPAVYSFYLNASNDRAVGNDENALVWITSQRFDVKVKKEDLDILGNLIAEEVQGEKNTAVVKWRTTGASRLMLAAAYSYGRFKDPFNVSHGGIREGSVEVSGIDVGDTVFTLRAYDTKNNVVSKSIKIEVSKEVNIIDVIVHGLGLRERVLNRSLYELISGEDCPATFPLGTICGALSFNNIWRTIGGYVTKLLPGLGDLVGTFINFLKDPVVAIFGVILEIVDNFVVHKNTVKDIGASIMEFIGGFVKTFIPNFIAGAAEGVFNKLMGDCIGAKMGGWINIGVQALYSGIGGLLQLLGSVPFLGDVAKIGEQMTSSCPANNSGCTVGICVGQGQGKEIGGGVLIDVVSGLVPGAAAFMETALPAAKNFIEPIATTIFPECKDKKGSQKEGETYTCKNNSCQKVTSGEMCGIQTGGAGEYPTLAACQATCGTPAVIPTDVKKYYTCKDPKKLVCEETTEVTIYEGLAGQIGCNLTCIDTQKKNQYYTCKDKLKNQCEITNGATSFEGAIGKAACDLTCKKTEVGCGCPQPASDLFNLSNPRNAKRGVANALMSTYYVATGGAFCVPRDIAYQCADTLFKDAKPVFSKIMEFSITKGGDLSQRLESIKPSDFHDLWKAAGVCGASFIANQYNCKLAGISQCSESVPAGQCGQ